MPGDTYLDDGDHYALAAKFRQDWYGQTNDFAYPVEWAVMATQKVRDAFEVHAKLQAEATPKHVSFFVASVMGKIFSKFGPTTRVNTHDAA